MIVGIDTNCIIPGKVGGIENYTLGLIEALKQPSSPATGLVLFTRAENHELMSRFADSSTSIVPIERAKPFADWASAIARDPVAGRRAMETYQRHKIQTILRSGVELVHFPGNSINPLDLPLPAVLNLHDLQHRHFPKYFSREEIDNREKWWVASAHRAEALIAASNFIRDDLRDQLKVDPSKIFVTPDVFESAYFKKPAAAQLSELRAKLSLPQTFFIYPAAAWPHKNHELLIRAFVKARLPNAQLLLTGGGQDESGWQKLIAQLDAEFSIRLMGRVSTNNLVGLYHLATGMIFPSQFEAWSIPIMEAMACGCPVASSNVTSLPEEVGDAGLLFAPDDIDAMAHAMRKLANDSQLRTTLSQRGRERTRAFGVTPFLQTITAAYQHACKMHRCRKAA